MFKVMFLCTGNSCRSQMAEGFAREFGKGLIEPYSAGLLASRVHPRAIAVMNDLGIDISGQKSKEIDPNLLRTMDIIITLCGNARKSCPWTPPRVKRLHWPIDDPVGMLGTEKKIMSEFRRARDEIKKRIQDLIAKLKGERSTIVVQNAMRQPSFIDRFISRWIFAALAFGVGLNRGQIPVLLDGL